MSGIEGPGITGGGGSAPSTEDFVTFSSEVGLPNSRVLTAGTSITVSTATPGQVIVSAASQAGRLIGFQVLTGSGTYTPTAGTARLTVVAIGGGAGAGGVAASSPQVGVSAGAGAGAVAMLHTTSIEASYAFACGAAGAGGSAGANDGVDGAATTFGTALLDAPGGLKSLGVTADDGAGGTIKPGGLGGAVATGGTINYRGEAGRTSNNLSVLTLGPDAVSGAGGSGPYGAGGQPRSTEGNGNVGTGIGVGGGGAYAGLFSNRSGGAGTAGGILVWEYS